MGSCRSTRQVHSTEIAYSSITINMQNKIVIDLLINDFVCGIVWINQTSKLERNYEFQAWVSLRPPSNIACLLQRWFRIMQKSSLLIELKYQCSTSLWNNCQVQSRNLKIDNILHGISRIDQTKLCLRTSSKINYNYNDTKMIISLNFAWFYHSESKE